MLIIKGRQFKVQGFFSPEMKTTFFLFGVLWDLDDAARKVTTNAGALGYIFNLIYIQSRLLCFEQQFI